MHQPSTAAVVGIPRAQSTDDGRVLQALSQPGKQLGDVDPRDAGRNGAERSARGAARFGIERLQLAGPAGQPQQDDTLFLPLQLVGQQRLAEDVEQRHVGRRGAGRERSQKASAIHVHFPFVPRTPRRVGRGVGSLTTVNVA